MASTALVPAAIANQNLMTDINRLTPQPGEVLVTIDIDGNDPHFPAVIEEWRWNGWAVPYFRREVAEAVLAWTNALAREDDENEFGHWEDDLIVMHAPNYMHDVEDYQPIRYGPDKNHHGRYGVGACFWTWELWHPHQAIFQTALNEFPDTEPLLEVWRRYPHVTPEDNHALDRYACEEASRAFHRFARERGLPARLVLAEDGDKPFVDYHWWVRVEVGPETWDVDWTARQYCYLEHPPNPRHANLPFPMIWRSRDVHPVAGGFRTVTEHL